MEMVYALGSMIVCFFFFFLCGPLLAQWQKYHYFIIHIMQFSYMQSIIPELDSSFEYQFNI